MSTSRADAGYRPYVPPKRLAEAVLQDGPPPNPDWALLAADATTLIWSGRLDTGMRAVFKMYRHRGPISWIREQRFRFRVQREFDALAYLDGQAIPCSQPLFWSYGCCADFGRYEVLATREIEGAVRMDVFVRERDARVAESALRSAYRIVRRMHAAGFHHGALYARNILVVHNDPQQQPGVHVIDAPKAILFPYDIAGTGMARIDLTDLTISVLQQSGAEACTALLACYGLPETAARAFILRAARSRSSRGIRNLRRAECEAWELLSRIGLRCASPRRARARL